MNKQVEEYIEQFNLYNYLSKDNTIYDFFESQLPIGDYSTEGLLSFSRRYTNPTFSEGRMVSLHTAYKDNFDLLADDLLTSLDPNGNLNGVKRLSEIKKERILEDLRTVSNNKFESIEEYIQYAKKYNFASKYFDYFAPDKGVIDDELDSINDLIVGNALEVTTKARENQIRENIIHRFVISSIENMLIKKYSSTELDDAIEYKHLMAIRESLSVHGTLANYDKTLSEINSHIEKFRKDAELKASCIATRNTDAIASILSYMSEDEREMAREMAITDILFGQDKEDTKNEYITNFKKFPRPKLILNKTCQYLRNGVANQDVIAYSYGRLRYTTLYRKSDKRPTYSSDAVELIGITRTGEEGDNTYFVFMPVDAYELRRKGNETAREQCSIRTFSGTKLPLMDKDNNEYVLAKKPRITRDLEEFYARTYFSDLLLSNCVSKNCRFLPAVRKNQDGEPIVSSKGITTNYDINAVRHALTFGTAVDGKVYRNLEQYIVDDLSLDHFCLVEDHKRIKKQARESLDDLEFIDI